MREGSAVKIKTNGVRGAIGWRREPHESSVAVDKPPDEPRACHAVDPEALTRGPDPASIFVALQKLYRAFSLVRLSGRQHSIGGRDEVFPGRLSTNGCFVREKIDAGNRFKLLPGSAQELCDFGRCEARKRFTRLVERPAQRRIF